MPVLSVAMASICLLQINYKEKLLQALKGSFQHFQEMKDKVSELTEEVRRSEEEKQALEERISQSAKVRTFVLLSLGGVSFMAVSMAVSLHG